MFLYVKNLCVSYLPTQLFFFFFLENIITSEYTLRWVIENRGPAIGGVKGWKEVNLKSLRVFFEDFSRKVEMLFVRVGICDLQPCVFF